MFRILQLDDGYVVECATCGVVATDVETCERADHLGDLHEGNLHCPDCGAVRAPTGECPSCDSTEDVL